MSSTWFWYATRASGLMALVLLTLTMVLGMTTTTRARARHWPGFAQQELHRRISMIAVVFLGIHVLTSVLDTFVNISWAGQSSSRSRRVTVVSGSAWAPSLWT